MVVSILNKIMAQNYNYIIYVLHTFFQLTYSTTRYGLYEVVSAELRKGDGKKISSIQCTFFSSTAATDLPVTTIVNSN